METRIYINVTIMGSVNQVLSDLLSRIKDSGLYDECSVIYLILNGDKNNLTVDLSLTKYNIIEASPDFSKWEFLAQDLLWRHSQTDDDFQLLYLHTKGVSKPGLQNIIDWTNYLSYFNINKWKDRVEELKDNDCTGVNLGGNPQDINEHPSTWGYGKAPLHYSGNFWWSKSSHIKKLPNPISWMPDNNYSSWRMMNEMWVCQIPKGKYFNAWSSNVNHYLQNYPQNLYKNSLVDIVVAKYKEDVSWTNQFKKSRIFIYDKSGENNNFINLPNIGREAHTYLTHIIDNYDNISDYVCFLQGNPYGQATGHLNIDSESIENFNHNVDYYPLSYCIGCDLDGMPSHPNLEIKKLIFDPFFIDTPDSIVFSVGALFIASKRSILRRKKQFYIDLLKQFDRTDIDNSKTGGGGNTPGNKMPWVMERVWLYIFSEKFRTKYDV